jgi:hypothetical protein
MKQYYVYAEIDEHCLCGNVHDGRMSLWKRSNGESIECRDGSPCFGWHLS